MEGLKCFFVIVAIVILLGGIYHTRASVSVNAVIPSVCGNGVIDSGEQCDGSNLGGQTCVSRGFSGGTLSCKANCTFDTSQCTSAPASSPSGGGGGGGGGGYIPPAVQSSVTFKGIGSPSSRITLIKDAQVVATTQAGPDAKFEITLSNISTGIYSFGLYANDPNGLHSLTYTFNVSVTAGVNTVVSGIFLSPTISADKTAVKRGDLITFLGYSAPQATISLIVNSTNEILSKTIAGNDGYWIYKFATDALDYGNHTARSQAATPTDISPSSQLVFFNVGDKNVASAPISRCPAKGDLNGDCKVNLIDFSIAAYWYNRTLSPSFALIEKSELDGDGIVDLTDFSIMAYYWTG